MVGNLCENINFNKYYLFLYYNRFQIYTNIFTNKN